MPHAFHLRRNIFVILGCAWLLSAPVFAGDKVEGKRYFELESGGAHYATANELCSAKAKERHDDKSIDNPKGAVKDVACFK